LRRREGRTSYFSATLGKKTIKNESKGGVRFPSEKRALRGRLKKKGGCSYEQLTAAWLRIKEKTDSSNS